MGPRISPPRARMENKANEPLNPMLSRMVTSPYSAMKSNRGCPEVYHAGHTAGSLCG